MSDMGQDDTDPLKEAIEDITAYLEDQPQKADGWTVGGVCTPYIGSLRIVMAELTRLADAWAYLDERRTSP